MFRLYLESTEPPETQKAQYIRRNPNPDSDRLNHSHQDIGPLVLMVVVQSQSENHSEQTYLVITLSLGH